MIEPVVRIRIELQELEAKIWRRVDVPLSATLAALHDVIQVMMGWTDSHLREFVVGDRIYGVQFRRPAEGAGRGVVRGLGGSVVGSADTAWLHIDRRKPPLENLGHTLIFAKSQISDVHPSTQCA